MPTIRHNPAAITVATLLYFALGGAWFTLFMNAWLAGIGRTMAELKASGVPPWLGYVVALAMTAILAIALSWLIQATGPQTAASRAGSTRRRTSRSDVRAAGASAQNELSSSVSQVPYQSLRGNIRSADA